MMKGKRERELGSEKVYLDANCFIYAALDEGKIGTEAKKILRRVEEGVFRGFTSALTVDEFLWAVQKVLGKGNAAKGSKIFFSLSNLEIVPVGVEIVRSSISFYQNDNLEPRDAIHLACMLQKGLKVIVSADSDFDKVKGIKRIDFSK